jgi:membrane fusion protein, multidrug efflux system
MILRPLRPIAPAAVACLSLCTISSLGVSAHADEPAAGNASALVQETPLRKGSLPSVVTAFGTVQGSAASRRAIMAPTAAVVAEIPVRPGERVARGAALIRLAPTPQTAASYAQARSALNVARQLAERTRQMLGQHLATRQQLAEAQKSESDARAALAALEAQGAGGSNVLKAPYAAIVTAVSTSRGAVVTEGTPLLELAGTEDLVLHAGIVPAAAGGIARGNPAVITALDGSRSAQGRVMLRGDAVDPATGLMPIDVSVPPGTLMPGETAAAVVTTGMVSGYLVPHEAVLVDDAGNPYVVQDVGGAARKVTVRVLASRADENVVAGRLDPAAPIVLAGNYQLEEGMRVRVERPAGGAAR